MGEGMQSGSEGERTEGLAGQWDGSSREGLLTGRDRVLIPRHVQYPLPWASSWWGGS